MVAKEIQKEFLIQPLKTFSVVKCFRAIRRLFLVHQQVQHIELREYGLNQFVMFTSANHHDELETLQQSTQLADRLVGGDLWKVLSQTAHNLILEFEFLVHNDGHRLLHGDHAQQIAILLSHYRQLLQAVLLHQIDGVDHFGGLVDRRLRAGLQQLIDRQRMQRRNDQFVIGYFEISLQHPFVVHKFGHVVANAVRQYDDNALIFVQILGRPNSGEHGRTRRTAAQQTLLQDELTYNFERMVILGFHPLVDQLLVEHGRVEVVSDAFDYLSLDQKKMTKISRQS